MKFDNNLTCILPKIKQFPSPKDLGYYLILDKAHMNLQYSLISLFSIDYQYIYAKSVEKTEHSAK